MANPLQPNLYPPPPLASYLGSTPSVSPAIFQGSHLNAILQALRDTPVPVGPIAAEQAPIGDQALGAAGYQAAGQNIQDLARGGRQAVRSGAQAIGEAVQPLLDLPAELAASFIGQTPFNLMDYVRDKYPGLEAWLGPKTPGAMGENQADTGSPVVGAPGTPTGASPGVLPDVMPVSRPMGGGGGGGPSASGMLTRPTFTPPDFSATEGILAALSPGTSPEAPTRMDDLRAGLAGAALGAASGRNLGQALALAGAGALKSQAEESDQYLNRLERYEGRKADIDLKKAEITSNLEVAKRNFGMQQERAEFDYERAKAGLAMQEHVLQVNEGLRRAELNQPYVGVSGNRLIYWQKTADGQFAGQPRMFVINELEDRVSAALMGAKMAKALGSNQSSITLGAGDLKATVKDPEITGALTAGMLWLAQNRDSEEGKTRLQQAQEEIRRRNPMLEMMRPDQFEAAVNAHVATAVGIGLLGQAAAGRGAAQFDEPKE